MAWDHVATSATKKNKAGKGDEGACHEICYNKRNCHNRAAQGSVELRVTKDLRIRKLRDSKCQSTLNKQFTFLISPRPQP